MHFTRPLIRLTGSLKFESNSQGWEMSETRYGFILVLSAAFCFGLNPVLAKLAYIGGLDAISALVYRFMIPALILVPFVKWQSVLTRQAAIAVVVGGVMGLGMLSYFLALESLSLPVAALIYFTYPIFTALYGRLFFGMPVSPRTMISIGLILSACVLIFLPSVGVSLPIVPVLLCFAAPAAFALLLHSLVAWLQPLPPATRTGLLIFGHVLVLLPFIAFQDNSQFVPVTTMGWIGAVGLATISSLIPQVLMAIGTPLIGAGQTSIIGAFELITAIVVGWVVLGEDFTLMILFGIVLISIALYITTKPVRSQNHNSPDR